jgi:hypothetical protein
VAYTYEDLEEWATRFFPAFRFSKSPDGSNEPFYPVDVDGWLTHRANDEQAPHRRGTAVYRWRAASASIPAEDWRAQDPVIGPGQVTLDSDPATGIGDARFATLPPLDALDASKGSSNGDWYLDFGGWNHRSERSCGQAGYSWKSYQDFVQSLDLPTAVQPIEADGCDEDMVNTDPASFTPDKTGLHAYVEFGRLEQIMSELLDVDLAPELAAVQQDRDELKERSAGEALKDILGLTYHLFYPAYVPPDGRFMEGQWEAVSVFLRDQGGGQVSFAHASYTQGYSNRGLVRGLYPRILSACRAADDVELDGDHPVAYVAWGSHANYFTPRNDEQVVDPEVNWGTVGLVAGGYGVAGILAAVGVGLIVAGIIASPVSWPLIIAGAVCLVIAAIIAVVVTVILALMTAADPDSTRVVEPATDVPHDEPPRNDTHGGDGSTADPDGVGTPAAAPAPQPGDVPFVLHPVSAEPGIDDKRAAPPSWWTYAGRWGVCVNDIQAAGDGPGWSNGSWRRRPDGYTPTHCNVEALLDYLHDEIDQATDTAFTNP